MVDGMVHPRLKSADGGALEQVALASQAGRLNVGPVGERPPQDSSLELSLDEALEVSLDSSLELSLDETLELSLDEALALSLDEALASSLEASLAWPPAPRREDHVDSFVRELFAAAAAARRC